MAATSTFLKVVAVEAKGTKSALRGVKKKLMFIPKVVEPDVTLDPHKREYGRDLRGIECGASNP